MRTVLAIVVALTFLPTTSANDWSEPRDGLSVSVLRVEDSEVLVTWTAAPGAIAYQVFRGKDLDDLELISYTPQLQFRDRDAPDEDTWYVIVSHTPPSSYGLDVGPMRGKCLSMRGLTGISVTLAHCAPLRWP